MLDNCRKAFAVSVIWNCGLFVEQDRCMNARWTLTIVILQCGWSMQKWRWGEHENFVVLSHCWHPLSLLSLCSIVYLNLRWCSLGLESWTFCGSRYRDKVYDSIMISSLYPLAPMTSARHVIQARHATHEVCARTSQPAQNTGTTRANSLGRAKWWHATSRYACDRDLNDAMTN